MPSCRPAFWSPAPPAARRQILTRLLETVPAADVFATFRAHRPGSDAAIRLSALGVEVRLADYDQSDTLDTARSGIDLDG